MSIAMVFLVVLALVFLGVVPTWPHSRSWGHTPSRGVGLVALILFILIATGRL